MKNVLAIIAMFACTSVCLGKTITLDSSNANHGLFAVAGNSDKKGWNRE